MPFTGSHPAAVLPLLRWLPPSALIIGSMVPDTLYFVPLPLGYPATHTVTGVFAVDLAMGVVLFALWQELLGPATVALAPPGLSRRLTTTVPAGLPHHFATPRRAAQVLAGLVVGALTHVIWDSFTHGGMWGGQHIAWLAQPHFGQYGYDWAQDASTVAGGLIVAAAGVRWWRRHPPVRAGIELATPIRVAGWAAAGLATLGGAAYGFASGIRLTDPPNSSTFFAATNGIAAGVAVLTAIALGLALTRRLPARS